MNVLALTIFVTLALVIFFIFLFLVQLASGTSRPDQDALLPLNDENFRKAHPAKGKL